MKDKRIVIITDSLGLPRGEPDNIALEETWTNMLIEKYGKNNQLYFFPIRGGTTRDVVVNSQDYIYLMRADVLIIQMGIVDCCRRVFSKKIEMVLHAAKLYAPIYKVVKKIIIYFRGFAKSSLSIVKNLKITLISY